MFLASLSALHMQDASERFLADMSRWMDSFYLELLKMSQCIPDEAWNFIALCIKRIFEQLQLPWAKAANTSTLTDSNPKLTTFLWGIVQAHQTMHALILLILEDSSPLHQ